MGHSCRTLSSDTLLWNALVGHSCGALLLKSPKVNRHVSESDHVVRDFLQNERFARDKPSIPHTSSLQNNVAYETSSKIHVPSLQNVWGLLTKSHVKVSKTSISHETSSKRKREGPSEHIHLHHNSHFTIPCACQENCTSTPPTRTKYCTCHGMLPPPHPATSRFPAPATKIALPHLKARTKYCARHEK